MKSRVRGIEAQKANIQAAKAVGPEGQHPGGEGCGAHAPLLPRPQGARDDQKEQTRKPPTALPNHPSPAMKNTAR